MAPKAARRSSSSSGNATAGLSVSGQSSGLPAKQTPQSEAQMGNERILMRGRGSVSKAKPPSGKENRSKATVAAGRAIIAGEAGKRSNGAKPRPNLDPREAAAVRLQAAYRGRLARLLAQRERARAEQNRLDREYEEEERQRREKAQAAAKEDNERRKREAEAQREEKRDAQLKAMRDRRCTIEIMCQGLPAHEADWEENPERLLELMDAKQAVSWEPWLGRQPTRRAARKRYLGFARRWHPDKWVKQGEQCVEVATAVTKCLVYSYEKAMRELPQEISMVSCEDDDEEKEVNEFASWVGISFAGMNEVWKERKGVKV